jgi:Zinc dependent phospholipase C
VFGFDEIPKGVILVFVIRIKAINPRPSGRNKNIALIFLIISGIVFFPQDALAWGPMAHLDFSRQLLLGTTILLPTVRALIETYRPDFLYGSVAADAVVGKNMANDLTHCHSWKVGWELLEDAVKKDEATQAFILGYLGHLAADVIAHNHFIPNQLVSRFRARGAGHMYWEARYDQCLLSANPSLGAMWTDLSKQQFRDHDRFLAERLQPTLFSHRISTGIFHRSLVVQGHRSWQRTIRQIELISRWSLSEREVSDWRALSVSNMRAIVNNPLDKDIVSEDPTGRPAIREALKHRRMLKKQHRRGRVISK